MPTAYGYIYVSYMSPYLILIKYIYIYWVCVTPYKIYFSFVFYNDENIIYIHHQHDYNGLSKRLWSQLDYQVGFGIGFVLHDGTPPFIWTPIRHFSAPQKVYQVYSQIHTLC
jgi:hypothetical protein